MAQAMQMRAPAHYLRVDLGDPAEREYWQVVLDASADTLQLAVDAVGPQLWEVREWLSTRGSGHAPRPDPGAREDFA
jgi:hypothetical protein